MRCRPLLASLSFLLAGCGSTAALTGGGNARSGAVLFVTARCVQCHAVNGAGGTSAPDLTQNLSAIDHGVLRSFIVNPPAGMEYTRQLHLSSAQIHDLSAFAASSLKPAVKP